MESTPSTIATRKKTQFLIGVVFIVLLGVAAFWYIPDTAPTISPVATSTATTTDPFSMPAIVPEAKVSTEGWKTCRNEEYGWEVKYPAEWYVYQDGRGTVAGTCQDGIVKLADWAYVGDMIPVDRASVTIRSDQKLFGTAYSAYTNVRDLAKAYYGLTIKHVFIHDGEEYVWLESTRSVDVWVFHNGRRFEIDGEIHHSETLETILSTFHFLDATSTTPAE